MDRIFFSLGALLAGLAVATGAFGAHALSKLPPRMLEIWETAARYHMYHALGLMLVAWAVSRHAGLLAVLAGWGMLAGIVLFSGSLYLLVLTRENWLGAVTPIGGTIWIIAWVLLAISVLWR